MTSIEAIRAAAFEVLISIAEDTNETTADRIGAAAALAAYTKPAEPAQVPDIKAIFAQLDDHLTPKDDE